MKNTKKAIAPIHSKQRWPRLRLAVLNDQTAVTIDEPAVKPEAYQRINLKGSGGRRFRLKHADGREALVILHRGKAQIQYSRLGQLIVSAWTVWEPAAAQSAWQQALTAHRTLCAKEQLPRPALARLKCPSQLPWIAISFSPAYLKTNPQRFSVLIALNVLTSASYAVWQLATQTKSLRKAKPAAHRQTKKKSPTCKLNPAN